MLVLKSRLKVVDVKYVSITDLKVALDRVPFELNELILTAVYFSLGDIFKSVMSFKNRIVTS